MDKIYKKVASNIKFYFEKSGLTQNDVVDKMTRKGFKVNQGQISKWLSGYNSPKIDKANALAEILGCTLQDFLNI